MAKFTHCVWIQVSHHCPPEDRGPSPQLALWLALIGAGACCPGIAPAHTRLHLVSLTTVLALGASAKSFRRRRRVVKLSCFHFSSSPSKKIWGGLRGDVVKLSSECTRELAGCKVASAPKRRQPPTKLLTCILVNLLHAPINGNNHPHDNKQRDCILCHGGMGWPHSIVARRRREG